MKRLLCLMLLLLLIVPLPFAARADNIRNWYEVFVRSYADGDGDGIGDLRGLLSKLDYITEMGYNGLWLMPIMPSPSYHKYDVMDYCQIDSQYGSLNDFRMLVEECHRRDICVIIDLPLNHTSKLHPWFIAACDALRSGDTTSPYTEYYNFSLSPVGKNVPLAGTDWFYEEQFSGGGMPDLNLENPAFWDELQEIISFWLCDYDVDGFRLDAVTSYYAANTEKNVAVLRKINELAKSYKPDCYLVGEAWSGLDTIAAYYESGVDSFFLFPASQAEGYIVKTVLSRKPAASYIKSLHTVYDALGGMLLAPFLSNHDTGRAVASLQARSNPARAKFAEALINLMGGATFTYYGEEIGMVGAGADPNKRLAMYWDDGEMTEQPPGVTKIEYAYPSVAVQEADADSLLSYCKALNHLKLQVPSIARGNTTFVYSDDNLCVLKRDWETETSYLVINCSAKETQNYTLDVPGLKLAGTLCAGEEAVVSLHASQAALTLPPYAIAVFVHDETGRE